VKANSIGIHISELDIQTNMKKDHYLPKSQKRLKKHLSTIAQFYLVKSYHGQLIIWNQDPKVIKW